MSDPEWCFWCPSKGCQTCAHKGSDDPNKRAKTVGKRYDWSGKDERPTAPTVSRSSHSDSPERKEGVAQ